jgi:hypothetical protein
MSIRVPAPRAIPACVILAAGLLAGPARAEFTVFSDFSNFSVWGPLQLNGFSNTGTIATGGNPGAYARIGASLQNSTFQGGGFLRSAQYVSIAGVTMVRMTLDYKFIQGSALSVVPVLVQESRAYLPAAFVPGSPVNWTTFSNIEFPRSSFVNSSGIPLNDAIQTLVGFVGFIRSTTPISVAGTAGVDNITIQGIPTPGLLTLLPASALVLARRRR